MTTYYTIDSGNTNFKVASFSNNGEQLSHDVIANLDDYSFNEGAPVIFCSVNQEKPKLSNLISLNDIKTKIDFKTSYATSLGEDRLATSYYIQKCEKQKKLAIVDAGTFITIDIIDKGHHLGGYIYPGLESFLKTYNLQGKNLPKIAFESHCKDTTQAPQTTSDAINEATRNYINSIRDFISNLDLDILYVTGGNNELFDSSLADQVIRDRDLLHKSLFYILKEVL